MLYKDIPITFYISSECVINKERVLIAWDHNGMDVKYLPCAFESIYVLDVTNLLEDLIHEDIFKEHVYDTCDYFNTI